MKRDLLLKTIFLLSIIINLLFVYFFRIEIKESINSLKRDEFEPIKDRVFYYSFDSFLEVKHEVKSDFSSDLSDSLVVTPNKYKIGDICVNFGKEGLYRVLKTDGSIRHVIVFQGDMYQLLSSISWIVTHGNEHNKLDINEKQAQATNGKLFLTCNRVVNFTSSILEKYKFKTRTVQTLASKDLNGYDDEHVLLEVFDPKLQKWILIDIDNNAWFSLDNVKLSLVEYKTALDSTKNVKIEKLSNDAVVDISNFREKGKSFYGVISENVMGDENLIKWHKRIMDIVTINKVYYNEKQINYMTKNKPEYSFKNHNDFLKEFYKIY